MRTALLDSVYHGANLEALDEAIKRARHNRGFVIWSHSPLPPQETYGYWSGSTYQTRPWERLVWSRDWSGVQRRTAAATERKIRAGVTPPPTVIVGAMLISCYRCGRIDSVTTVAELDLWIRNKYYGWHHAACRDRLPMRSIDRATRNQQPTPMRLVPNDNACNEAANVTGAAGENAK